MMPTLRGPALLAFVLVGLLAVPVTTPQASSSPGLEWWGDTGPDEGFHLRIPVTVTNPHDFPIKDGAVLAHIDIADRLIKEGWVHDAKGAKDQLASFNLDSSSIRVVEMTNLKPSTPGTTDGRLKTYDTTLPVDDPRKYEVPSTHYTGFLQDAPSVPYDARLNPIITVLWRVEGLMDPDGVPRHFVVYFDSLTNSLSGDGHPDPDYRSTPGGEKLQNTFWAGPATELVGRVQPILGMHGVAKVLGLHDGTTVHTYVEAPGGGFRLHIPTPGQSNPFTVDADGSVDILLGKDAKNFRFVADRPILALVDSEGYVPTRTGGFVGQEFLFATTYPPSFGQDGLFFYNKDPRTSVVVDVQSLDADGKPDGSNPVRVHLTNPTNPFPYTWGTRAEEIDPASCTYPTGVNNPVFLPGRTYRASASGPVAIQFQPAFGVSQIPDLDQGGMGSDFWTALSRSVATQQDGSCTTQTRQYQFFAASPTSTHLQITNSYEAESRLHPAPCSGSQCPPGQPFGPDAPIQFNTIATGLDDRPMQFSTGAPAWLMVGPNGQPSLSGVALRGPLGGGDAGRLFAGFGSTKIFAPFEDTRVDARIDYATQAGVEVRLNLVKDRLTSLPERPGNDPILWYTLTSDRPIIALPQSASSGSLAGVPPLLAAQLHEAEFRGRLVDVSSVTGLNPVTRSTVPGTSIDYQFRVTNLGRGVHGADLPDTIELCPASVPAGWKAKILDVEDCDSPAAIQLAGGASRQVTMSVTAPTGAVPGDLGVISLRATSRNNPSIVDSAQTVTHIKRSFDVGLWFDAIGELGGTPEKEIAIAAGQIAEYAVVVQNRGSVQDTFTLSFTPPAQEWEVLLNGQVTTQVTLAPLGAPLNTAELTLRVVPPQGKAEDILITTITAKSESSPAVLDRITATTKLQAPSDLVLEVDEATQWVDPGGDVVFTMTLRNQGEGTARVRLDLQTDSLPGWQGPAIFFRNLQTGTLTALEELSLGPGDVVPLAVAATAALDATAGQRTATRFHVSANQGAGLEAFLYTIVNPVHNLTTHLEGGPTVQVDQGGTLVPATLRLTNDGNLDERLRPTITSMPPGWTLTFPADEIQLPRNHTQAVGLALSIPNGTEKGDYVVEMSVVSTDGNRTKIQIPIRVAAFTQHLLDAPDRIQAQPGRPTKALIGVTNQGNTPITITAEPHAGEPWVLDRPGTLVVPPGASMPWSLGWVVPRDVVDGVSTHRVDIVIESTDPAVETTRRIVEVGVDLGRADLRVHAATGFPGAAGQIIHAVVANDGLRPAYDVAVQLRVGTETIDQLTIATMNAGSTYNVTFLQPDGVHGSGSVFIDPADQVAESNENNNVLSVRTGLDAQDAPGVPAALLLAAVALIAWMRRRT